MNISLVGGSANGTGDEITTTTDNCLIIASIIIDGGQDVTAIPAGWNLDASGISALGGSGIGYGFTNKDMPTAGATGNTEFTHGADQWIAMQIAIAPA